MPREQALGIVWQPTDARPGVCASLQVTLSATPNTVTAIGLPDSAFGLRLLADHDTRFAIDTLPAVLATSALLVLGPGAFAAGAIAHANTLEVRTLPPGPHHQNRTLYLISATASTVVTVEVF